MNKSRFNTRIEDMPTSIFSVMSKLAVEYNAVNLGQGFPDFDGPDWIIDEAYKVMKAGKINMLQCREFFPCGGL